MKHIMNILILIVCSSILMSFSFNFKLFAPNGIRYNGTYRAFADGSFAKSCLEYLTPSTGSKRYSGDTGDGIYRIKPDAGTEFDVYCDMTTNGGGWTLVLNLEANDDVYGWSNAFWTNTTTLNTTTFNSPSTQSKYQSFNNVAGTNIMYKSHEGTASSYTVNSGALGSSKTMYQIMQSPVNTVFGSVGINMQTASTYSLYGINYYRIGVASGNVYYSNIGWGTAQVSVTNPASGCPQHSGGVWGINSYTCTACDLTNAMSDSCGGNANLWNALVFIK